MMTLSPAKHTNNRQRRSVPGLVPATLLCLVMLQGRGLAQEAELSAAPQAGPGGEISVTWRGLDAPGDFITIADPEAPAPAYHAYARTNAGNPAIMTAPPIGDYEIRYISAAELAVLARAPLRVAAEADGAMTALALVVAGADVTVTVMAAGEPADYVTIVEAGAPDTAFGAYARLKGATEVRLQAPMPAGEYEIRHIRAASQTVLARLPLTVETAAGEPPADLAAGTQAGPETVGAAEVAAASSAEPAGTSSAPVAEAPSASASLMALVAVDRGLGFQIAWEGPGADGDWIGVVPAGSGADDAVGNVAVGGGSPAGMTAPGTPGDYEIIYVAGDGTVLGLRALEVR